MALSGRTKRPARVLFAAIVLIVVYFFLFPYPLGRELVARPRWAVALPAAAPAAAEAPPAAEGGAGGEAVGAPSPFQLGDRFGFIRADGGLLYTGTVSYRVALSSSGFVSFTRLGTDWILQDTAGRRVAGFSTAGYPLLSPDGRRVFSIKTDLSGIIEMDLGGGVTWDRDFPSVVTALSVQGDLVLVGLLNGTLALLDRHGAPLLEQPTTGSRVPIVVGAAAAPDGSRIAAVRGIDPQYLAVLRRTGAGYEAESRESLPYSFRREVRVGFSPDSRWLYVEGAEGPALYDPGRRILRWVSLPGPLAGAASALGGRVAAFVSRDGRGARLVLEPFYGVAVGSEPFPAREVFLGTVGGQLLLGWDGVLARIDVEAM